jgi:hypothetical protein
MTMVLGTYMYPQAHGGRLAGIMHFDIATIDWNEAADDLAAMISGGLAMRG